MKGELQNQDLRRAILRKAIGYEAREVVEEYSADDQLIKRKISIKQIPPDLAALKAALELEGRENDLSNLSDVELEKLKIKLLKKLGDIQKGEKYEDNNSDQQS